MLSLRSIRGLAVLMVSLSSAPAFAELGYLEYSAGVAISLNQNLTGADATGAGLSGRIEPEPGYHIGAAVGTTALEMFGAALRAEIAINYRDSNVDGAGVGPGNRSASGNIGLLTAMVNAYIDYDLGLLVVPYIGAGVGYGRLEANIESRGPGLILKDEASVFAWNLMLGGTLPVSEVVDVTTGYRYVATTDPRFDANLTTGSQRFDSQYDAHEVVLGLRIHF